jgi:hypothetical protein
VELAADVGTECVWSHAGGGYDFDALNRRTRRDCGRQGRRRLPLRAAEDEVDPVEHEFDIRCPESPDALAEQVAVDGDESRGRRVRFAPRRTMPGAEAQRRLLVNGTTTTSLAGSCLASLPDPTGSGGPGTVR